MSDFFKFVAYILKSIYNALDIKIFPDMPITYSQFVIGLIVLISLLKFLIFLSKTAGNSLSFNNLSFGSKSDSSSGYQPKHSYQPRHAKK